MATIPMGNYGQRIADAGQAPRLFQGDPVGEAGQGVVNTAQHIVDHQQALQKQRDEVAQRATAALALAKVNNALHDAHDQAATGIADGSMAIDDVGPFMQKQTAKVRTDLTSQLSPEQRAMIDDNIETTSGTLGRSLNGVVQRRKQSETAATIDQFGEQVAREGMRQGPAWAAEKYGAMVDFSSGAAGWSPEIAAKKKQAFTEGAHYAFFDAAGTGAFTQGNVEGIQSVRDQMSGPAGEKMDPVKRVTLDHQLFGYQQNILAKRATAANKAAEDERKRYNEAVDVFNKGSDLALAGAQFSPDFIKEMTTAAEGTSLAPDVLALIGSQARVAGFATQSATDRTATLESWRAERATPGVGTDPLGEKLLKAAETIDGKLRQQFEENPWVAAQSAGVIQHAGEIQPGNPGEALAVVSERMKNIRTVEAWGGKKTSPLQPQEVEQVGKLVRTLPVDQAASLLAKLGQAVGDNERVAALSKQIGDKDGNLGLAMMYANNATSQGRYTAELVLRGEQAIRDKIVKPDEMKETGWRAEIAKQVRGAYSNRQIEDAAINAAFLILSARTADSSRQADVGVDNAVHLATGGITERNGAKVPLPGGMREADFDKAIRAVTPQDLAAQAPGGTVFSGLKPIPLADFVASLQNAQLVHAGQGLYNVRTGTSVITNGQGQRITIKVKP